VRGNKDFFTHLRKGVLSQRGKLNSLTSKVKKNITAYIFIHGKTLRLKISEGKELAVTYTGCDVYSTLHQFFLLW
jgi:hypothetical protein